MEGNITMPGQECDIVMHETVFRTVKIAGKVDVTHSCHNKSRSNLLRGLCYGPVGSRCVNGYGSWCGQIFPEPQYPVVVVLENIFKSAFK